jgi:hypothetical protein
MNGRSGMDMNLEEIELADHAAISAMEVMCKNLNSNTTPQERAAIAREAYKMATEMVVARRKFIQVHADDEALGMGTDEDEELDD